MQERVPTADLFHNFRLGVSVALVDASEGFLVGATVGALLIAIGLITLIVGAILYAATS